MTAPSAATEVVEIREIEQSHAWQDFRLSGMPRLISAMHLCHAIHALAGTGMLARLRAGANTIGSGLLTGLSEKIGTGLLRYLVLNGVLEDTADGLSLTRRGELLTSDVSLARLGIYVGAYSPVTSRLTDLLSGSARYDVDVQRNGGELGRHCATLFSAFHTGILMEAIRGRGVHCVLDIGCGGGSLLVDLCKRDTTMTGIGVDISPDAVEVARELAEREGVADRLEFFVADGFQVDTWPDACRKADALVAVSALHEHFRDGEQAVVDILDSYASFLPDQKLLLVGEPEMLSEAWDNHGDFFLVHVLTDQGLPRDRSAWLNVFARSRLACQRIYVRPDAGPRICFYDLTPRTERTIA
jgi:SAM-dependent methyltransferase